MSMKIQRRFSFSFNPINMLGTFLLLAAILAQPFYSVVHALQVPDYTVTQFTDPEVANWKTDRAVPSGDYGSVSYGERDNVLEINIDKDNRNNTAEFYYTEGLQKTIEPSDSIKAELYVDSDWAGKTVRAGLWGVGRDASGDISAYPIIEYTSDSFVGWRAYDSNTGFWTNISAANNGWNTLEIVHNATTSKIDYKVNGTVVNSYDDSGTVALDAAILNSKNYGPSAQSYSAHWSNFGYGQNVFVAEKPNGLSVIDQNGNPLLCGSATKLSTITAQWSPVVDASSYNYRSWAPLSTAGYSSQETAYTTHTTNTSMPGSFPLGEGPYNYQVQTVYGDGSKSVWSDTCTVTYDKTLPTTPSLQLPANNSYINVNDFYFDWSDSSDASALTYEFQSSQNPATTNGELSSGVWNNVRDGNSEQKNLTSSTIHSVGANNTWYWQVRAIDAAGNKSAWTTVWKTTIDIALPIVTISSPAPNATVQGTVPVTVQLSDLNIAAYNLRIDSAGLDYAAQAANGQRVFNLDTTKLSNGLHTLLATATDKAGNKTTVTQKINVTNPAPTVSATDFGVGPWAVANDDFAAVSVGFTATDFETVTGINVDLYDAAGKFVTNTATTNFLSLINSNDYTTLSSPFVTSGTFTDDFCGGGECWNRGTATWTAENKPVKAVITVTGTNGAGNSVTETDMITDFTEDNGTFGSILPLVTVTPTPPEQSRGNQNGSPQPAAPVLPLNASPVAARRITQNPSVVTVIDDQTDADVLGASTEKPEVLAATTTSSDYLGDEESALAADAEKSGVGISALWWLTVPVALGAGGWILAAARRNND